MAKYRKFIVAGAGFAAEALVLGLVPAPYDKWVTIGLAALTALGVRQVPNAPLPQPVKK